ncbi:hypothetical protein INR49_008675, partial [Caranx melampygus]
MEKLLWVLLLCHRSPAEKHTIVYVTTVSTGVTTLPETVVVGLVDDIQVGHCDSNINKVEPKQTWMKTAMEENPEHLQWYAGECFEGTPYFFKANIHSLKQRFNQSGDPPSVSLLQKTPSSPITCHATGFYPQRALMIWTKDGEELHEDVDQGEILPNNDGTFQMSVDLDISSVKAEDWRRYDCVFHLSGMKDAIVIKLDKALIRTNMEKPSNMAVHIISALVPLVLILIAVTGLVVYKQRK